MSSNEIDSPDIKHNFFIIEIGREKESYPFYFYNEAGVDFHTFIVHIKTTAKKAASIFADRKMKSLSSNSVLVDDFTIHFNAVEHMTDFNYKKFEPHFIIIEDRIFEIEMNSSVNIKNDEIVFSGKNDFGVFELAEWNGLYHDAINRRFFKTNNSFHIAHKIAMSQFNVISDKINAYKKTIPNFEKMESPQLEVVEKNLELIKKDFSKKVSDNFMKNGFDEVFFHAAFIGCNYSLSGDLIDVIGNKVANKLCRQNKKIQALTNLNRTAYINSTKIPDEDLPF